MDEQIKERTNSESQSKRSKDGYNFEHAVYSDIARGFQDSQNVLILKPKTQTYPAGSKKKHKFSCLQIKTAFGEVIGDSDIVLYNQKSKKVLAIVSCKTSVRERMMQSIGNREMYRKQYGYEPELYFVTNDPNLEFGTEKKPRKYRVVPAYMNVKVYSTNPETEISGVIYPYSQLLTDLRRNCGLQP